MAGVSIPVPPSPPNRPAASEGGIRQDPAEKLLYLSVPDIDAALKQIEHAGGKIALPRTVVPGVVTFALFTDPAGNRMGLAEASWVED